MKRIENKPFAKSVLASALLIALSHSQAAEFTVTNLNDSGDGSLRSAIDLAKSSTEDNIIVFESSLSGELSLQSNIDIRHHSHALSIDGGNAITILEPTSISNPGGNTFFLRYMPNFALSNITIDTSTDELASHVMIGLSYGVYSASFDNVTIANSANAPGITGLDDSAGWGDDFTLENSTITGMTNTALNVGFYYAPLGDEPRKTITINNCVIRNTQASNNSPAVRLGQGVSAGAAPPDGHLDINISNLTIQNDNDLSTPSGGLEFLQGYSSISIDINNSTFSGLVHDGNGGAINIVSESGDVYVVNDHLDITISNSTFENNTALKNTSESGGSGGAINIEKHSPLNEKSFITIENNVFYSNSAQNGNGGAISIFSSDTSADSNITLSTNAFTANTANANGGALNIRSNTPYAGEVVHINASSFSHNSSNQKGGGAYIFVYDSGDAANVVLSNSTFSNNTSDHGTALFTDAYFGLDTLDIRNTSISNNHSTTNGDDSAAIRIYGLYGQSKINLINTVIAGNTNALGEPSNISITEKDATSGGDPIGEILGIISNNFLGTDITVLDLGITDDDSLIQNNLSEDDPGLDDIGGNGGNTLTLFPNSSSPLINAGNNDYLYIELLDLTLDTDQRGFSRIEDETVDIGAVEYSLNVVPASGSASMGISWLMGMSFLLPILRRRSKPV